ncbi:hypothetical protein RB195_013183 [Necator americanus]
MANGRHQYLAPPSRVATRNRIHFFGHMLRRPADRLAQRVLRSLSDLNWKRLPGRKVKFWTEVVKEDLRTLGMDRLRCKVSSGDEWIDLCKLLQKIDKVGQSYIQVRHTSAKMQVIVSGDDIVAPMKSSKSMESDTRLL